MLPENWDILEKENDCEGTGVRAEELSEGSQIKLDYVSREKMILRK